MYIYIYTHHINGMSWFIWHCNEKMMCVFFRPARITGLTAFAQKWGRKLPLFDSELNVQLWHLVSLMVLFCFREHMNTYAETHGWMDGWMVTRLIWRIIYAKPSFYYPSGKGSCWRGFPSEGTGGVFKAGSSRGLVWFTELQCLSNK